MKLRGKIIVAFLSVMIFPLLLMTLSLLSVVHVQYSSMEQSFGINQDTFSYVTNPVQMANRLTWVAYNEVKLCATKTPERLENLTYVHSLNERMSGKCSFLVVRKNGEVVFPVHDPISAELEEKLPAYGETSTSGDGGTYLGGETPFLVKQQDFLYPDGSTGSAFVVTDMNQVIGILRDAMVQIVLSVVGIMFLTAAFITFWLYRSLIRPLQVLQLSTNRIKEGDLDVSVKPMSNDEIGELCGDFEEMRIHVKNLLEANMKHQRESKELISNISHDLKTPLTAIKGYAEGILDGVADTPEKRDKYLRTIYTKANDMSTLVDELSMYSKIDTNSVPYNFQELNLHRYFEDSVEETQLDLELQNMDLVYLPHVDKEQKVIADPEQLKRVVNNIITNAVKYREPSRKGIICIRTTDIDDYYVRIEIEDNGKGIAAEDLPNIFDRFYRTDASRNSSTGGSGLGLAISRKIMEDHGGKIWAESHLGVGTTIFILLRKVWPQTMVIEDSDKSTDNRQERHGLGRILRSKTYRK